MKRILIGFLLLMGGWSPLFAQNFATANLTIAGTAPACLPTACVSLAVNQNTGGATFTNSGTWMGTVSFYGSGDGGVTLVALTVYPSNSTTGATTATGNGTWQVNPAGYTNLYAIFTTATSGTVVATIRSSVASARAGGGGGGGGLSGMTSGQVPIAATASTVTSSDPLQGTDSNILTSGTVSGTSVALCTDANGGATTSSCPSSGPGTGTAKAATYWSSTSALGSETTYYMPVSATQGTAVNAAIAACSGGTNCIIKIANGASTIDTGHEITVPANVILEGSGAGTVLTYGSTSAAITLSGTAAQAKDFTLTCSAACVYGLNVTGNATAIDHVYLTGGSTTGTLVGVHGNNAIITNIQFSATSAIGVECDNAGNMFLEHINFYGTANNTTAIPLVIDSACRGTQITDFQASYAGLHGFVVQNTLSGGVPNWMFIKGLITDDPPAGDNWVFDSTLGGSSYIGATIENSWAAGAGSNDSGLQTSTANNVRISGGMGITIADSKIRVAGLAGVLINNANVKYVTLSHNIISNNNLGNTAGCTGSGIVVSANVQGLVVVGNTSGNINGDSATQDQTYGLCLSTTGSTDVVISDNNFDQNVTGAISDATTSGSESAIANVNSTSPPTSIVGAIKAIACGVLNTTSCVLTGYGSTSGNATVTWPAVAGTTTNPIVLSNTVEQTQANIGAGITTDSYEAVNTTAATNGAQVQNPPTIHLQGQVWNSGGTPATNTADWLIRSVVTPNSGNPYETLYIASQINGGGYTNQFYVNSFGNANIAGTLTTSFSGNSLSNGNNGHLFFSGTAPTISSGFGSTPSIAASNGTAAFTVNVGTGGSATAGVVSMPTASTGWICSVNDLTAANANKAYNTRETATSTTSVSLQNQTTSTGAAVAWAASDILQLSCWAY